MKHKDYSQAVGGWSPRWARPTSSAEIMIVPTPAGYVYVWRGETSTYMRVIFDGRVYTRAFAKGYSQKYCVTLAKRFVSELAEVAEVGDE